MNTIPRWLLVGMVTLTVGVNLVVGAWDEQSLRHEIHQLEIECRVEQARLDRSRVRFQREVVAARGFRPTPEGVSPRVLSPNGELVHTAAPPSGAWRR